MNLGIKEAKGDWAHLSQCNSCHSLRCFLNYSKISEHLNHTKVHAKFHATVEFKSICQSHVMEGTWRAEIWLLSWVTKGYWRKAQTVTTKQIWQFWPKFGFSASKWLILALVAYPHYEFDTKWRQSVQLNSYNWQNFDYVTASKVGWQE
jgi:hypothetical protein